MSSHNKKYPTALAKVGNHVAKKQMPSISDELIFNMSEDEEEDVGEEKKVRKITLEIRSMQYSTDEHLYPVVYS